jgi:hypothetical protein
MKTEKEINTAILKLSLLIKKDYPELSKYIDEGWNDFSNSDETGVKIKKLSDYYNSLNTLYNSYKESHVAHDGN